MNIQVFLIAVTMASVSAADVMAQEIYRWDADSEEYFVDGELESCISLKGGSFIDRNEMHRGSGSLRHSITDSQRALGCDPRRSAQGGDIYDGGEAYLRWWMKIGEDMDWGSNQKKAKFARLTRTNEQVPSYTTMYLLGHGFRWAGTFNESGSDNNITLNADFDPGDGSCRSSALVNDLGADCTEWREYIFYYKRNTCPTCTNGIARFYINGRLVDEQAGIAFGEYVPSDGVTTFKYAWAGVGGQIYPQICPNGETCGAGGTMWIDDISISSGWNSMEFSRDESPRPRSPAPLGE